jgi:hypothetical protein
MEYMDVYVEIARNIGYDGADRINLAQGSDLWLTVLNSDETDDFIKDGKYLNQMNEC